jgi:hypothetical protein
MKLNTIQIEENAIFKPSVNIMQDLYTYVNYVKDRYIKRTYRDNYLPKTELTRLTKLMISQNDPDRSVFSPERWVYFIEKLAHKIGLVSFNTEGEYMGFHSYTTSYPNNYIKVPNEKYDQYMNQTPIEQEKRITYALLKNPDPCESEFFNAGILGRLDRFLHYGCRSGVAELLNFEKSRQCIMNVLKECQSNVWYSTQSLVAYIKKTDPFFLISKQIRKNEKLSTYRNFQELDQQAVRGRVEINESDPDAFERVEGRYIERFLEGIPLVMNYVELAYDDDQKNSKKPSINKLKAFKVTDYFLRIANNQMPEPEVWIQPNFEIQVISEIYPSGLLANLSRFADIVQTDRTVSHLKLKRKKVLNEKLKNENLDIVALLEKLSKTALAQNVITEINGWCEQSEIFTLYENAGLLETKSKKTQSLHHCKIDQITPTIQLIRSPDDVYQTLEQNETVPILIRHEKSRLKSIDDNTFSIFVEKKKKAQNRSKEKKAVTIKQQTTITLFFSLQTVFDDFQKRLIKARCPVESDSHNRSLTIPGSHEQHIKDIVKDLKKEYKVSLEY